MPPKFHSTNDTVLHAALSKALRDRPVVLDMSSYTTMARDAWEECPPHRAKDYRPVWVDMIIKYLSEVPNNPKMWQFVDANLQSREWLFATLTFDDNPDGSPPGIQRARKAVDRFLRNPVRKSLQNCVIVLERGDLYGRIHLHGVFGVKGGVHLGTAAAALAGAWQGNGHCKLEVARNASHILNYVSKYMTKSLEDSETNDFWFERFR